MNAPLPWNAICRHCSERLSSHRLAMTEQRCPTGDTRFEALKPCVKCKQHLPPERELHRAHLECVTRLPLEAMTPEQKRSARDINHYVVRGAIHDSVRRRRGER